MAPKVSPRARLTFTICISFAFFVAEIAIGFKTRSLALIADAFHYLNDLIGFIVALAALIISERSSSPQDLSFGWQRARLLGAFFNGVFLLALGVSVLLQSIERFVSLEKVNNPKLVLIVGSIGLGLNIISAAFLHEHDHGDGHGPSHGHDSKHSHGHAHDTEADTEPAMTDGETTPRHTEHRHLNKTAHGGGRDLNMLGALIHVLGDAANNVGVIISAVVIWKATYPARFYADPATSMGIAIMILLSAIPLVKNSGAILLQSAPQGLEIDDVKHDLEKIPGIESVHELHIWRLDQQKAIASAHMVVSDYSMESFMEKARTVTECLHAYGVHSATLQPELSLSSQASRESAAPSDDGTPDSAASASTTASASAVAAPAVPAAPGTAIPAAGRSSAGGILQSFPVSMIRRRRVEPGSCQIPCGTVCERLSCCTTTL